MSIDIKKELRNLGIDYNDEGNNIQIEKFSSINESDKKDATFCYYDGDKAIDYISRSNAGVILCKKDMMGKIQPRKNTKARQEMKPMSLKEFYKTIEESEQTM